MKEPDPVPGPSMLIFIGSLLQSVLSRRANTDPYFSCSGEQRTVSERQMGELELELNANG